MTRDGIEYIRGMYKTAKERIEKDEDVQGLYSRGYLRGCHLSTIDLCEAIALFERFSLVGQDARKGVAGER